MGHKSSWLFLFLEGEHLLGRLVLHGRQDVLIGRLGRGCRGMPQPLADHFCPLVGQQEQGCCRVAQVVKRMRGNLARTSIGWNDRWATLRRFLPVSRSWRGQPLARRRDLLVARRHGGVLPPSSWPATAQWSRQYCWPERAQKWDAFVDGQVQAALVRTRSRWPGATHSRRRRCRPRPSSD